MKLAFPVLIKVGPFFCLDVSLTFQPDVCCLTCLLVPQLSVLAHGDPQRNHAPLRSLHQTQRCEVTL